MNTNAQHHHVILAPKLDCIDQARDLLLECASQIALHAPNGPSSWSASFDEEKQVFHIDALFPDADEVVFHQENILSLTQQFASMMAAPPVIEIRQVFVQA